jgi:uncharacterized delta-60 repeat protein
MRGSILVNFDELVNDRGIDAFQVFVNSVARDYQFTDINNYYSTFAFVGDIVRFLVLCSGSTPSVNIVRKDYTTDDENGDSGIKYTSITPTFNIVSTDIYSYTFTASTRPDAYNFHYIVDIQTTTPTPTPTPTMTPTPLPCFDIGTGFNDTPRSISRQSNGRLVISGDFITYNSTSSDYIIRLYSDGFIDTPYIGKISSGGLNALQSDNKIIVGGSFNTPYRITRFNSTGTTIDNTFITPTGTTNSIVCIKVLSDDSIMLGLSVGAITNAYDGQGSKGLVKLNSNGSINTLFPNAFEDDVLSIEEQTDGKLVIGGRFTNLYAPVQNRIVRLNTDFSIDTGFTIGTGFNGSVNVVKLQSDGKILCGGEFTSYDGTSRIRICRLNTNGTLDTSFVPFEGGLILGDVHDILIQSDGKIILLGSFRETPSGTTLNGIVRYNSDGSLDNTFNIGTGFSGGPVVLCGRGLILPDGDIIVLGNFTGYNGLTSNRIIRLNSNGIEDNCP